jgi:hypothetical protein
MTRTTVGWLAAAATAFIVFNSFSSAQDKRKEAADEYIKVEVRGRLAHGIAAIGGETTGTVISAKGATWELDLRGNADLIRAAEKLDGRTALVTGALEVRKGVEIRQRWIVTVTTLKAG